MMKINETILLYKIYAKKDTDAFGVLYDTYITKIYRFVRLKISHDQEAEDVTSEVFLKAWRYLTDGEQKQVKSFSGLIYRIARNQIIDWYRDKPKRDTDELTAAQAIRSKEDIATSTELQSEFDTLLEAMKKMKQEYQEVVLLRYVEEMSIAEIAEIVGKKRTAVRVTLHRAMKKLKELSS